MKQFGFAIVCAVGVTLSVGSGSVSAQQFGPPQAPGGGYSRQPTFSPYLNLLRGGSSPALNYFGIVRPQMQFRDSMQNLANDVNMNQQAISNLAATGNAVSATGHRTMFMNYGGIFMNNSGGSILASGGINPGGASGSMSGGSYGGGSGGSTFGGSTGGGAGRVGGVGGSGGPSRKR